VFDKPHIHAADECRDLARLSSTFEEAFASAGLGTRPLTPVDVARPRGTTARLAFATGHPPLGILPMLDLVISQADGFAERREALGMLAKLAGANRKTVAADRGYDTRGFVADCRELGVTPHVAQNANRPQGSAIDRRTTRQSGYRASQIVRRRIETIFGWLKTFGGLKRTRVRGVAGTQLAARLAAAAYNLLRMSRLAAPA
jgi:Transposase DDE domain